MQNCNRKSKIPWYYFNGYSNARNGWQWGCTTISEIKWQCPRRQYHHCDDGTLQQTKKRCLSNGMNDYLSKPSDFNVLLEKLYTNLNLPFEKRAIIIKKKRRKLKILRKNSRFSLFNRFYGRRCWFYQRNNYLVYSKHL
jgi:hypothetical protein